MRSFVASDIKDINRRTVFNLLKADGELSKADINRRTGISTPTVMKIVDFFMERGLVAHAGVGRSAVGKKPRMLRFDPESMVGVGVDFEGEILRLGLVDLHGRVSKTSCIEVKPHFAAVFSSALPNAIESLLSTGRVPRRKVAGIGIGFPGVVDSANAVIEYAPLVGICGRTSFAETKRALEDRFEVPVCIENDVNADALGEFTQRKLSVGNDLFYVSLGTGLGAGIIIDGKLWKGRLNSAGEIGYMTFDKDYRASRSRAGWLEKRVNLQALTGKLLGAPRGLLTEDITHLIRNAPPERIRAILDDIASDLGLCIANAAALLDIQLVVLGGITAALLGDSLLEPLRERLERFSLTAIRLERVQCAEPGIVGAAIPAMEEGLSRVLAR